MKSLISDYSLSIKARFITCFALCFFALVFFSACASRLHSHSYESRFFIADKSVAYLGKAEWKKIELAISERKGYVFSQAIKLNDRVIEVRLEEKGNKYKGIYVFFELDGNQWKENKEKEEDFVLLTKKWDNQ
jgi:hypothetical protein